jgi:hypothetical protein
MPQVAAKCQSIGTPDSGLEVLRTPAPLLVQHDIRFVGDVLSQGLKFRFHVDGSNMPVADLPGPKKTLVAPSSDYMESRVFGGRQAGPQGTKRHNRKSGNTWELEDPAPA